MCFLVFLPLVWVVHFLPLLDIIICQRFARIEALTGMCWFAG